MRINRNPIAKALRSPHLKMQVVKNKKTYTRKTKHKKSGLDRNSAAFLLF